MVMPVKTEPLEDSGVRFAENAGGHILFFFPLIAKFEFAVKLCDLVDLK